MHNTLLIFLLPICAAFQPALIAFKNSRVNPSFVPALYRRAKPWPITPVRAQTWDNSDWEDGLEEIWRSHDITLGRPQPWVERNKLDFPYGISNFVHLRSTPNFFYVDKTYVIRELEKMPRHVFIHRPARWGKSLMLSMLDCYYDISRAGDFATLFGGLEIGENPTPLRNSYYVLTIDLSINVDYSMEPSDISRRLESKLLDCVRSFASRYNFTVPQVLDSTFGLRTVAEYVKAVGGNLLILIDEYDRFANKLMFESPEAYNKLIVGISGNPQSSPIRGLFESIKEVSGLYGCRSIVTGITPIALADAAGPNIWMDVSGFSIFGDAFGFSEDDLRRGFYENGVDPEYAESLLDLMRKYYNGFRFPGSSISFYNPTLALFFLFSYFHDENFRRRVDDFLIFREGDIYEALQDDNISPSENVFALLCKSPCIEVVCSRLLNEEYPIVLQGIPTKLRLSELLDVRRSQAELERRAVAFLYYHGLATITSTSFPYTFQVPNEMIRGPFLTRLGHYLQMFHSDIACFEDPTPDPLEKFLQGIVDRQETIKDNSFSERALQCELESALKAIRLYVGGFYILAERKAGNGFCDLLVGLSGSGVVFEIKRVRPNAIDYSYFSAEQRRGLPWDTSVVNWRRDQFKAAEQLLSSLTPEELRALRIVTNKQEWYANANTVADLEQLQPNRARATWPASWKGFLGRDSLLSPLFKSDGGYW